VKEVRVMIQGAGSYADAPIIILVACRYGKIEQKYLSL